MGKKVLVLLVVFMMLFTMVPFYSNAVDSVNSTDKIVELPEENMEPTSESAPETTTITTTPDTISIPEINVITAPAKGQIPVSTIDETTQYTAAIEWVGAPTIFEADTVYSATITITPKDGFTLEGVAANFFTVTGAIATNAVNSGEVTAVFPKTEPDIAAPQLISAATNSTGNTVTLEFDKAMADPSAEAANFDVKINGLKAYNWSGYSNPVTQSIGVNSASLHADSTKIDLILAAPLQRGDIVTVDYAPGTVMAADGAVLEAFTAQPVTNNIPVEIISNLDGTWQIFDHVGNWFEEPYPTGIDDDPRGNAFNRHIVINGAEVTFCGNGILPFIDFLYLPSSEAAAKGFSYDLDLTETDWHTLEGGGFLFNSVIDDGGALSGYAILFSERENYNESYTVKLYQIDNVDVDTLHNYNISNNYDGLSKYSGVTLLDTFPVLTPGTRHSITLETSSKNLSMWDGATQLITNYALPTIYGNGVGLIGSYISHSCPSLSYFTFSSLKIQGIANLSAVLAGDQANLTFTAPQGATSVKVEQSTDGVTWAPANLINPINAASTTATVTGLSKNQTYYFRLDITGGKYDGYSRVAIATYIVGPITDLTAKAGDGTVGLAFTPPAGAVALNVEQSTDGGETWEPALLKSPITPTSTTATATGLINGQQYSFKVVVTAEVGGGDSNIVNATPFAQKTSPSSSNKRTRYTLTVKVTGEGTVEPEPGKHTYNSGTKVELKAEPAEGYTFEGWIGATENSVLMNKNKTVTAVFKQVIIEPVVEPVPDSIEPTPVPTPTPEPEVPAKEETPSNIPDILPQTGGIPAGLLYGLGGVMTLAGSFLRRKLKH